MFIRVRYIRTQMVIFYSKTNNQKSLNTTTMQPLLKTPWGSVRNLEEKVLWPCGPSLFWFGRHRGIPFPFHPGLAPEVTSWKQSQQDQAKTNNARLGHCRGCLAAPFCSPSLSPLIVWGCRGALPGPTASPRLDIPQTGAFSCPLPRLHSICHRYY